MDSNYMADSINYDTLMGDVRQVLEKYGVDSLACSLTIVVLRDAFEKISVQHQGHHGESGFTLSAKGKDWYVQFIRKADSQDAPDIRRLLQEQEIDEDKKKQCLFRAVPVLISA